VLVKPCVDIGPPEQELAAGRPDASRPDTTVPPVIDGLHAYVQQVSELLSSQQVVTVCGRSSHGSSPSGAGHYGGVRRISGGRYHAQLATPTPKNQADT
jgi:hypothetical protein